jgi:hypothetical protein
MVLGIGVRQALFWTLLGTALMTLAVAADNEFKATADVMQVGVHEFRLEQCVVSFSGPTHRGTLSLQLPSPCQFHRGSKGEPRFVTTKDALVLLVESSRRSPSNSTGVLKALCDTQIQGIVIRPEGVFASKAISKVKACPPFQWDEKMFLTFAEEPSR